MSDMHTAQAAVMTVGYQGREVDQLVEDLSVAGVEIVVDVRLTPLSRKPGLSKTKLAEALRWAGIGYVHLPQLGNPRDNRAAYRNAEAHAVRRFRGLLESPDARDAVDHLRELASRNVIALLCFERDPEQCHRALIIEAMAADNPDLDIHHI
ncbi:DUF488 family protein [Mycobacterium seoulense]|uniref:DUF488 domain-containing protein n=1 Tax=Mycobacterium seoulense TaxID=386911 RepID=UPI003CEC4393